jgi:dipeptidyl aminopeptidase/acylaminoacyl peptidase
MTSDLRPTIAEKIASRFAVAPGNFHIGLRVLAFLLSAHVALATTPPLGSTSKSDAANDELARIFRPFETNSMTLSPTGEYLAYTERHGSQLYLVLRNLEENTAKRLYIAEAEKAEASGAREKTPAAITFMRWAADDRLVFNVNGENVWSVTADGSEVKRLGDANTYAPAPPPNRVENLAGPLGISDGAPIIVVTPPSALEVAQTIHQPVHIAAMMRGDRYVYLEALMKERGLIREHSAEAGEMMQHDTMTRDLSGTPHVVLRVDTRNGKQTEWAEAPESKFVLCDLDGHPRVIARNDNIQNASSLQVNYLYAPDSLAWKPLDRLTPSPLGFHVRPENQLGERSVPLGFGYDPAVLYFASNVGRDTFGVYGLNTKTWQRTNIAIETNVSDLVDPLTGVDQRDTLVLDPWTKKLVGIRYTGVERAAAWLDPELQRIQKDLNTLAGDKHWEIIEWDKLRRTFLVLATSNTEPGTYYVFHPEEHMMEEIMSQAPWLTDAGRNPARSFGFQTKAGVNLSGYLTVPRRALLKRPPLVVLCHDGPWERDLPGYNREAQALAQMGFIVLQVNYRGSAGFGRKHLDALKEGFDTVALDDIEASIDAITPKNLDRRLVAIMGHGYGGYLALRAIQLRPKQFRCAIAWDAPADLATWTNPPSRGPSFLGEMRRAYFGRDDAKLQVISPLSHPDQIQSPVMIIEADTNHISHGAELATALKRAQRDVTYVSLSQDEAADLPQARAELFRRIHDFLNVNIYNYAVKIGEVVEKK